VMLPEGRKFRPGYSVSRADLADAFVRAGLVSQFVAASAMYTDVRDIYTRNSVESVQSNPNGRLFYDAPNNGRFYPNNPATRLAAAVAMVKAAGISPNSVLPLNIADVNSIPDELRGFVAAALENGYISLDGNRFNPNRAITRIELAQAMNTLVNR